MLSVDSSSKRYTIITCLHKIFKTRIFICNRLFNIDNIFRQIWISFSPIQIVYMRPCLNFPCIINHVKHGHHITSYHITWTSHHIICITSSACWTIILMIFVNSYSIIQEWEYTVVLQHLKCLIWRGGTVIGRGRTVIGRGGTWRALITFRMFTREAGGVKK